MLKLEPSHREALTNKAQGLREMASEPQAGLASCARHVIGCRLTRCTRVKIALDDVAGNVYPRQLHSPNHGMPFV